MLVVFSTCVDFIRTVPFLQHDPDRHEDVYSESEDHAADECRYACMSRPWIAVKEPQKPADVSGYEVFRKSTAAEDWKQF